MTARRSATIPMLALVSAALGRWVGGSSAPAPTPGAIAALIAGRRRR